MIGARVLQGQCETPVLLWTRHADIARTAVDKGRIQFLDAMIFKPVSIIRARVSIPSLVGAQGGSGGAYLS